MRLFARIVVSILFVPLFILFILVTTIRFEVLNYAFLTNSLAKHNTYESVPSTLEFALQTQTKSASKDDPLDFKDFKKIVTPQLVQEFVEKNLKIILSFVNGTSKNTSLYFPAKQLSLPVSLAPNNEFPLSSVANGTLMPHIASVHGVGNHLWTAWASLLVIVLATLFGQYKLGTNHKASGLGTLIFICGFLLLIVGIASKLFLISTTQPWLVSTEPSHKILALLAPSLFSDMANIWLWEGVSVVVVGIGFISAQTFMKTAAKVKS